MDERIVDKKVYVIANEDWKHFCKKKSNIKKISVTIRLPKSAALSALFEILSTHVPFKIGVVFFDDGNPVKAPSDIIDGDLLIVARADASFGTSGVLIQNPAKIIPPPESQRDNTISFSFRTALTIIPPKEIWPRIQAIRQDHCPNMNRWPMPHINLLFPFLDPASVDMKQIASKFRQTIAEAQFTPFRIYLREVAYFTEKNNGMCQVYFIPETREIRKEGISKYRNTKALRKFHKLLSRSCGAEQSWNKTDSRRRTNKFTPHMSLGQWSSWQIQDEVAALQKSWEIPLEFDVTSVCIMEREGRSSEFKVTETIDLHPMPETD